MITSFAVRTVATALALWAATMVVSGIHVEGGWATYLFVALVFGLVNGVVGTVVKFFSLPLIVLTLGLFLLVVNAAMLGLTAGLLDSFSVDNFGSALLGAFIVAVVGAPTGLLIKTAIGK